MDRYIFDYFDETSAQFRLRMIKERGSIEEADKVIEWLKDRAHG